MTWHRTASSDQVAIVGMGCTPFGEHWDRSTDDMLIESSSAALASAGIPLGDVDAFWLGHDGLGRLRASPSAGR